MNFKQIKNNMRCDEMGNSLSDSLFRPDEKIGDVS